jgi:hypothetical protein
MASKIKVDNITDQDDNSVISRCGSTHTVTAEVYKANTIQDTSGNAYIAKCGSTVTIGGCGQTLALAAGTTNELGGGGVDWQTTPKTTDFNAVAGEGYFLDTTSNEITVTLPTGVAGESVTVLDYVSNANTNAIIFAPQSGEKIEGGTAGQGVTANRQATTLTYSGATQGWLVSSSGDSGPIVAPTITFTTASGSLGSIAGPTERGDPNTYLSPVTGTSSFGTVSYSIQSGSLPAGLTLNSSTGAFVGTATEQVSSVVSNFTVRITVTETGTTSDRAFSITVNPDALYVAASGGTETTSGDFKIHTFTGPGTFTVSCAGNAAGSNSVDYLVVAGGGGGGGDGAGGGGAGGYRISYPNPGTGGLPVSAQGYPITVGGGGPAGYPTPGANGSNSVFSSITSSGGGGGGGGNNSPNRAGQAGGSGGGGGARGGSTGAGNTPPVSPPQGNPGANPPADTSGGGGGAGGSASNQNGGSSSTSDINASSVARAGGGGGGGGPGGPGGSGGGGGASAGTPPGGPNASNASANTGSGAGGGGMSSRTGGAGGSGIVIIRYKFQ